MTENNKIQNINNTNNKRKNEQAYKKLQKKLKLKKKLKNFMIIFIFFMLILVSPFFQIKTININDLKKYTKSEILEKMKVKEGINIIFFNKKRAENFIIKDTYIESCNIVKKLPNTLDIEIKERKVRGYVPYMGSYLYIDEYGRVLDIKTSYIEQLPIVKGLNFNEFKIGEILNVDNKDSFEVVVRISQMMTKYELLDFVVSIDVSNPNDIHAYSNNIEVLLGDISDYDRKIRTMSEIIKQIPKEDRGTLDLRDMSKPIIFKYLT